MARNYKQSVLFLFLLITAISTFGQANIAAARLLADGTVVTVTGVAINGSELGNIRYIQDNTAGIALYGLSIASVQRGDNVTVTGSLSDYNGLLEVVSITDVVINSSGNTLPAIQVITPNNMSESYEAELIKITGATFNDAGSTFSSGSANYNITAGGQTAVVRVVNTSPLAGQTIPIGTIALQGVETQYSTTYQLLLRDANDIIITSPIANTSEATNVTINSATLNGVVNASSLSTSVSFEYGTSISYGSSINASPSTITGTSNTSVSANLAGLTANTTYHYRVKATNSSGTTYGLDKTFSTVVSPFATTQIATSVSGSSAVLNGLINANGVSTNISFEYGLTTAYGSSVIASPSILSNATNTSVTGVISGLNPNTTYHFRLKATNSNTTVYGSDLTFNTLTVPIANTYNPSVIGTNSATLNGLVNASNNNCSVSFEYGTTTAYGNTIAANPSSITGSVNTNISASLTSLLSNTTYHYRVKVVSSAATVYGLDVAFTTGTQATGDTLLIMHYNLMYHGVDASYAGCDQTTNNVNTKEANLKIICDVVQPSILAVNEISPSNTYHQRILDNVLNTGGKTYYKKGTTSNLSGSNIINGFFYDSRKLVYVSQTAISTSVRDINLHKLYYKAADLATTHDTAYIIYAIAHLKAGDTEADASSRGSETMNLMGTLNYNYNSNYHYFFSGDCNFYTSTEVGYQNLINYSNPSVRFYDPINMPGDWNNNSAFKSVHTQSTRTTAADCFSTGGLDDRFDFILASSNVVSGSGKLKYVANSYKAYGQDGNRFNGSIISPTNNLVGTTIANALYNLSDHIPVIMKVSIDQIPGSVISNQMLDYFYSNANNPITDKLKVIIEAKTPITANVSLYNSFGQQVLEETNKYEIGLSNIEFDCTNLKPGFYILYIKTNYGSTVKKLIKL